MKRSCFCVHLVTILFFFLIMNFVLAPLAEAGLRIDKPKVRMSITPGSYDGGEIKVENTGQESLPIKVYLEDWIYKSQDGGKEFMAKGTAPLSCASWITFYPADFTLPPGGTQIVRYTVTVPDKARGGHYSVMFFETVGGEIENKMQEGTTALIKVLNRVGSLFYVDAEGTVQKTAEIKDLSIGQNLNRFTVTADLINTGNTDITTTGTFDVIDDQGFVYVRGAFDEVYTLPKDKVALKGTVPLTNLKAGTYDMLITLDFQNGGSLVQEVQFTVSSSGAITSLKPKT